MPKRPTGFWTGSTECLCAVTNRPAQHGGSCRLRSIDAGPASSFSIYAAFTEFRNLEPSRNPLRSVWSSIWVNRTP
jgi:hypothetical protein